MTAAASAVVAARPGTGSLAAACSHRAARRRGPQPTSRQRTTGTRRCCVDVLNVDRSQLRQGQDRRRGVEEAPACSSACRCGPRRSRLDELSPQIGSLAAESYRSGRVGAAAVLLGSGSPDSFLERAVTLNEMNLLNDQQAERAQHRAWTELSKAKAALDAEVKQEQKQLHDHGQAEAGRGEGAGAGRRQEPDRRPGRRRPPRWPGPRRAAPTATSPPRAAPRTTRPRRGCVTPRTLHAYKEVRRAASTGSSAATAPAGRSSTRRAAPATGRWAAAASGPPAPATSGCTATTWPRSWCATPTGSASCT